MRHVAAVRAGITPPDWQPGQPATNQPADPTFGKEFATPVDPLDATHGNYL
jgi:hypothetical protein